jgi:hypothetical protein
MEFGPNDTAAIEILTQRSYSQLRKIFKMMGIDEYIKVSKNGHFWVCFFSHGKKNH